MHPCAIRYAGTWQERVGILAGGSRDKETVPGESRRTPKLCSLRPIAEVAMSPEAGIHSQIDWVF